MPELPEVQTIACGLEPQVLGRTVVSVDILWPGSVHGDHDVFHSRITGATFEAVERRAKLLLFRLRSTAGEPLVLASHLKMTGRFVRQAPDPVADIHARVVFHLDEKPDLVFHDTRKFGYVQLFTPDELERWPFYASLGPEPLELNAEGFAALFRGRRGRIKALLLNQQVIAGIGNIYADESLHRAGIRPDAPANRIGPRRLRRLHGVVQAVLQEAIDACGSSIRDYRDAHGDAGAFQNSFRVYGRACQPCRECETPLTKTVVAGRTTCFCPRCQRR